MRAETARHDPAGGAGLILIELIASRAQAGDFVRQLKRVPGVDVQRMIFPHQ